MRGLGATEEVKQQIALDVQHIYSHTWAFIAKKTDGSMVTWGEGATDEV